MPIYPERALKDRVRGLVIVRVLVSEEGVPVRATVEKPAREDLTRAAVEASMQWRFRPALKNGHPVRTFATLRFPFEGIAFARTPSGPAGESGTATPTETPTPGHGEESWRLRTPRSR
jgi:TonB family protein